MRARSMLVSKGETSLKSVELTAHSRKLEEISCSSLRCILHPQPLWVQDITETCATVAVERTRELCLSLLHYHRSLQWQKQLMQVANTLLKSTFPPLLFAVKPCKTLQSWRFAFLLANQDHVVLNAFKQRKRACLPQRPCYKVSWITCWVCYSLSEQMTYSCSAQE